MRRSMVWTTSVMTLVTIGLADSPARAEDDLAIVRACTEILLLGLRPLAAERTDRFLGKVSEDHALCWGGDKAVAQRSTPWVDWSSYWAAGDLGSKSDRREIGSHILDRNQRGIDGALIDLEYQRMELIRFNLFDNKTFEQYATGGGSGRRWLDAEDLEGDAPAGGSSGISANCRSTPTARRLCKGELIRHRTLTGICNDIRNPAMGSTGQLFARNVEFESTFPDLEHDPSSRRTAMAAGSRCSARPAGDQPKAVHPRSVELAQLQPGPRGGEFERSDCAYKKAPFFNVLAAFWIQFMTHDWFSHMEEARNDRSRIMTSLGCATQRANNVEQPLPPDARRTARLPPGRQDGSRRWWPTMPRPSTFEVNGKERLKRSYKTTRNNVTAWWDASQIYGYDDRSLQRVRRDPADPAKLEMQPVRSGGGGDQFGYLPVFRSPCAPGAVARRHAIRSSRNGPDRRPWHFPITGRSG